MEAHSVARQFFVLYKTAHRVSQVLKAQGRAKPESIWGPDPDRRSKRARV